MLREDEVFATKLALAGPWGHVQEVLVHRNWKPERLPVLARRLDVPPWQTHLANTLQCLEILRWVRQTELTPMQRHRARAAVGRMYLRRQQCDAMRRARKLMRLAAPLVISRRASPAPSASQRSGANTGGFPDVNSPASCVQSPAQVDQARS